MIDATCSYLMPSMPSREKQTLPIKYMMRVQHLLSWKKTTKLRSDTRQLKLASNYLLSMYLFVNLDKL